MTDDNSSNPGTEPVATESEMVQAVRDQYEGIQRIGNSINLLMDVWHHAVYRLAALKRRLEARHPGELDAEYLDLDHVARLTRVIQADKYEYDLLSAIERRIRRLHGMIDELEDLAIKLKVKARADGGSGAHDFAQETEDRLKECRRETNCVAEQIVKQREEIMEGC